MNRRDLFKGIIGAAAAAPVVKAAKPEIVMQNGTSVALGGEPYQSSKNVFRFCETCGAHHTASIRCIPRPRAAFFTLKQQEAWAALHNPDIRMVLFSGGRGCGKTFLVDQWKKSLTPDAKQLHVRRDRGIWHMRPASYPGFRARFDSISIDDANDLPEETFRSILESAGGGIFKLLLTATPAGPGIETLRTVFPETGWNGTDRYHVNAASWDNPHLARGFGRMEPAPIRFYEDNQK